MSVVKISRTALKAIALFQADKDVRYYLNGVFVQSNEQQTRLCATTGHFLGLHRGDPCGENVGAWSGIIPRDSVKTMLAWKAPKYFNGADIVRLTVPDDYDTDTSMEVRAEFAGNICVFKTIDGRFPDYSRIIPTEVSGAVGQFNAEYLHTIQKACSILRGKDVYPAIAHNGDNGAYVAYDNFLAVVMPLRSDKVPVPDVADIAWGREPLPVADVPADETTETVTKI